MTTPPSRHFDDPVLAALDRANIQLGDDIALVIVRVFRRLGFDYRSAEAGPVIKEECNRMTTAGGEASGDLATDIGTVITRVLDRHGFGYQPAEAAAVVEEEMTLMDTART